MSGPYDDEIARLYREGVTNVKAIRAKVGGISERSVCRALVRTGCRASKSSDERPDVDQRMVDMLVDGASYNDVAETFDVPVKWLRETIPGYGWDGSVSGSIAHALRDPRARQLFHEIRKMPLPRREEVTR